MEISSLVPEEKICEGFLPYMGMAAFRSCDPDAANNLRYTYPWRCHTKFSLIGQAVLEKMFEIVNGRTTGDGYTISSPCEPLAMT